MDVKPTHSHVFLSILRVEYCVYHLLSYAGAIGHEYYRVVAA